MTSPFTLHDLADVIATRASSSPELSYTAKLLQDGVPQVAKKFGEEAVEAVIAAVAEDDNAVITESADVLYHLLVMLQARGIPLDAVFKELKRRTAQSGLAEKAARKRL